MTVAPAHSKRRVLRDPPVPFLDFLYSLNGTALGS